MVLGRQEPESTAHGMDYTVNPIEGLELSDQLHDAVKYIRGTYQEADLPELGEGEAIDTSIPADPNVKNYSYTVVDGAVYFRENSRMVRPDLNATAETRVKGLVGLRECVQQRIAMRTCKNCGKYFALTVHGSTEYCSRVFDSRGRTCKEVGAMRQYLQSHAQDELLKIYRREYKRRFAWIRAGKISQEAFSAWSKEAQKEKEKCEAGEISQGEFAQWLKR